MKPGLAVLPLEVWTDVFVYSWIARQKMAQIVDRIGNRKFAEKLQFRLHDYGKQSLRYLQISSKSDKPKYELRKRKIVRFFTMFEILLLVRMPSFFVCCPL